MLIILGIFPNQSFVPFMNILHNFCKCGLKNIIFLQFLITINVPVVFMARYVMILRGATSLRGALEGVGPEKGPKKLMPQVMMWHPSKSLSTAP